ncbi:MAG TPA: GNAT family N-acetyltransferase [Cytophagales bacterium]|nr:GNAT family N-acetyltransferase [Cytophagales bacterium]
MRKEVTATKKYWFVWNEELNNPCAFDAFLFNDPGHLALQPSKNRHSYYLIKKHDEVIYARCTFFIEGGIAYSPYKSSFGSIEFSDKVFFELLEEFWDLVEEDLKAKGAKEIMIKNYPVCYHPGHAQVLSYLFSTKGFSIKTQELNFHIEVDERGFEEKVHENERKKLNKCLKKHYVFKEEKVLDLNKVHTFIASSRNRKSYPTTLTKNELEILLKRFPERFAVFTISLDNRWAALCVLIKVNKAVLYTFYGADGESFLKDSPLVLLHLHLYDWARENKFSIIDLGIGSAVGIPNKGLIRFKEKIGGKGGVKLVLEKNHYV